MKNYILKTSTILLLALACFLLVFSGFNHTGFAVAASENGIFELLNDDVINLYETEIAKEKVITDMRQKDLDSLASKNDFSLKKVKALVLLSDLSKRVNDKKTFLELAGMNDLSLLAFGKKCVDAYAKTLSESEQARLKGLFLSAIKNKNN